MDFVRAADACSAAIEADQKKTGPKWMPADGTCAARKKEFQKRGVRLAQMAAQQKTYAISGASSMG
jgi:hypothetical protein